MIIYYAQSLSMLSLMKNRILYSSRTCNLQSNSTIQYVTYKLLKALEEISQKSHASEAKSPALVGTHNENKLVDFPKGEY